MSPQRAMRPGRATILCVAALLWPGFAWSHAFPDHQSPGAGVVLSVPPKVVQIWFDGALEPVFSTITVEDASGRVIAKGAVASNQPDPTLLQTLVPELGRGTYHVEWSVVARDGHRTEGRYTFIVQPSP